MKMNEQRLSKNVSPAPCRTQGVRGGGGHAPRLPHRQVCDGPMSDAGGSGAADTPPGSHEFTTGLPRARAQPPTGPRPPYPHCQKPEYMVLRYCMGDIPAWRLKIR